MMKKLLSVAVVGGLLAMTASASAGDRFGGFAASPGPSTLGSSVLLGQAPPAPAAEGEAAKPAPMPAAGGPLYDCVKYKDLDEMHPCAVPKVISVREPEPDCDGCACCKPRRCGCARPVTCGCAKPVRCGCAKPVACGCAKPAPCSCCRPPRCVKIKICVPPCGCERVEVKRDGRRVTYDYGKYEVDVRVKKGYIEVDYQD